MVAMKRFGLFRIFITAFAVFLFVITATGIVFSAETGSIAIYPTFADKDDFRSKGWFIYNLKKSERLVDYVTIYNPSEEEALTIDVYPVDALTTQDGVFSLANRGAKSEDVGAWIRLSDKPLEIDGYSENEITRFSLSNLENEKIITREILDAIPVNFMDNGLPLALEIEPLQKKIIPFEIIIPDFADTGDHAGGIVAENKNTEERGALTFVSRVGARIYETIPGEIIEKLNIDAFDKKEGFFDLSYNIALSNAGNVRAMPKVSAEIKNIFTGGVKKLSGPDDRTVLPLKNIVFPITFKKNGFGIFEYSVFLQNKEGSRNRISRGYFASMEMILSILAVAMAMVLVWVERRRRRRNRKRRK